MRTFNCVSWFFRLLPVFMGVVSVLQVHSAFGMSGSPEQRDSLFSVSDSTYRQVIREGGSQHELLSDLSAKPDSGSSGFRK